jgi:hypothetical protein
VAEFIGQCGRKFLAEGGNAKDRKKEARIANSLQDFFGHLAHQIRLGNIRLCKKILAKSLPTSVN